MEKEKEFFNKMRVEQIDSLIRQLNELKDDSVMTAFRNDKELYKHKVDDIFNSFDKGNEYMAMKKFFDSN